MKRTIITIIIAAGIGLGAEQASPPESAECAQRVERIQQLNGELRDLQARNLELSRQRDEAARKMAAVWQGHLDSKTSMLAIANQKGKSEKQRLSEIGAMLLIDEPAPK